MTIDFSFLEIISKLYFLPKKNLVYGPVFRWIRLQKNTKIYLTIF